MGIYTYLNTHIYTDTVTSKIKMFQVTQLLFSSKYYCQTSAVIRLQNPPWYPCKILLLFFFFKMVSWGFFDREAELRRDLAM